jgi:chemotaxis protein CheZ
VQRKVFRVEEMAGGRRSAITGGGDTSEPHPQLAAESMMAHELSAIRSAITRDVQELSVLINDGNDRRMARAAGELGAAVDGMEKATQRILSSAEAIDDCARALASTLSDDYHHRLAEDVQDHVVGIYEACNFQDLAGQRIGKVITLLIMIEERLASMIARNVGAAHPAEASRPADRTDLNGPRLDGSAGHASQHEIDAMFA